MWAAHAWAAQVLQTGAFVVLCACLRRPLCRHVSHPLLLRLRLCLCVCPCWNQVSPEQGRFMALLVQLLGVKTAVEVRACGLPTPSWLRARHKTIAVVGCL